jgi:hypothetical protein
MSVCLHTYDFAEVHISVEGGQCEREAHFVNSTLLCRLHNNKKSVMSDERRKGKEEGSVSATVKCIPMNVLRLSCAHVTKVLVECHATAIRPS